MRGRMIKVVVGVLISTVVVTAFAVGTEAQRRRQGRRGQQPRQQVVPQSEAIAPALGDLSWGMTSKQVFNHFVSQTRERYREPLSKARDAMDEDRLRHDMQEEVQRIRRSYVRFRGQTSGWDVSFLRPEFTHGNNESMMVLRDSNSQNFYFFINNRLWKWYKAFDASVFAGQTFEQFAGALQTRFGEARERSGRLSDRGEERHWLEWQDAHTRLRAVDENRFYGFYCLVFEDKETLANLETLRSNRSDREGGGHALVDAVTSDTSEASTANQDVVDRLTGRIRRRTDAPEGETSMGTTMDRPASSMGSRPRSDDPLHDLAL